MDAAQLAEAFELFSRASEDLSSAYNALQGQVAQLTDRLNVLMGALPAGVVVLDGRLRVMQMNRAAVKMFGDLPPGTPWTVVLARLENTETQGELMLPGDAAPRRLALSQAALESGDEYIVLLHDITDTHRMRQQFERNERLVAMGEMVAGLAHQLRTPLSAAMLFTANLRQPELPAADRVRVADRAIDRLRHLERLIRDMLLFARGDSLGRQCFALCDLLQELAHTLEPLARSRGVSLVAQCECGQLVVLGDRKALGGALTNLLDNALNVSGEGGRVSISAVRSDDFVVVRVSDTGPGIDESLQARLFEPFFTTRADGTGLGLAIARGVARAHGGDISIESRPGEAAVFVLSLPFQADLQQQESNE